MTGLGLYDSIVIMPFTKGHKINLGRKHSPETIEKLKTTPNTGQFKKGMIPWSKSQKGIHLSPETEFKKGMIPWNKGKQYKRGEDHWNWSGGVSPKLKLLREHIEYKEWRTKVFERDDYTCQICGVRGGEINADHIKSFRFHEDLRYELSNGRTICVQCHQKLPTSNTREHICCQ